MNYRHIYHAGSFADIFKHVVLITLLEAMQRKDKPFCFLDTHAGIGCYDLQSKEAKKTKEYSSGIEQIVKQYKQAPAEIETLLTIVQSVNKDLAKDQSPHFYPGSPRIARYFLRSQDRMILTELHPQDALQLKNEFYKDPQVAVHNQDGYLALKAFLPPKERRGLVLIDPPYEQEGEADSIIRNLKLALQRWESGVYAIWYPIKEKRFIHNLCRKLRVLNLDKMLLTELTIYPEDSPLSLNGSAMVIINPPWQLEERLKILLPWLWEALSPQKSGGFRVTFSEDI